MYIYVYNTYSFIYETPKRDAKRIVAASGMCPAVRRAATLRRASIRLAMTLKKNVSSKRFVERFCSTDVSCPATHTNNYIDEYIAKGLGIYV